MAINREYNNDKHKEMKTMRLLSNSTKKSSTILSSSPSRVPESFLDVCNTLPHLENIDLVSLHDNPRDRLRDEDFFDSIMNQCNLLPLHEAFESDLCKMFNAERAILWENRPNLRDFHSSRLEKEVSISNPIIDLIISKKKIVLSTITSKILNWQLNSQQIQTSHNFFSHFI